jgi:hypothetical protein
MVPQKCKSHLQILGVRMVTGSNPHNQDPKILRPTSQKYIRHGTLTLRISAHLLEHYTTSNIRACSNFTQQSPEYFDLPPHKTSKFPDTNSCFL